MERSAWGGGARVAVVGGGVAGSALAAALLHLGRKRGSAPEVTVFSAVSGNVGRPVLLTPECRSRLAAMHCDLPGAQRTLELSGVLVVCGGTRTFLAAEPHSLFVLDAAPDGLSGEALMIASLRRGAEALGGRFFEARVNEVERVNVTPPGGLCGPGALVVRAHGRAECFDAVALATGAEEGLAGRFFKGYSGAPTMPAAEARIRHNTRCRLGDSFARLILNPLRGVDALVLLPCLRSSYALAYGPAAEPADLCQALMMASRDGHLSESFELAEVRLTRVPYGVGKRLVAPGQLTVGSAAMGHPLQWSLAAGLAGSSRAAMALFESDGNVHALRRRWLQGTREQQEDSEDGTRASHWLRHCGARGGEAFSRAVRHTPTSATLAAGVLGLSRPTPLALAQMARWIALGEASQSWLRTAPRQVARRPPPPEPSLYYVVDDDQDTREALTELLEARGATVVSFADELGLFCSVARRPPTAILLDVVLTWADGLRLCEGLKEHPLTRETPVFVMSGLGRPHVKRRALQAGAEAFLTKPIDPALLWRVLGGRWTRPRAEPSPGDAPGPPLARGAHGGST